MAVSSENKKITVAVLLGYYHGEKYILEQLESILSQGPDLKIWISDDGNESHLKKLLEENGLNNREKIVLLTGPKAGFTKNFSSLIGNPSIQADYYAFSDQDDIWKQGKLDTALDWLKTVPSGCPACYCSRTQTINERGQPIGLSPLFSKRPSFKNALIQSIAGANTMVMNGAARDLMMKTKDLTIVSHDWWAYILITGAGGQFFYDPHPKILYRQHGGNIVGSNSTIFAKLKRVVMMLEGRFRNWNDINVNALEQCRDLLTPTNKLTFDVFCEARNQFLLTRMSKMFKSGVYRQTFAGNVGFMVATFLKRT
jgi:glycosyltransferase involved in cell wall biosynthesis